jgi:hypothetical protein
MRKSLSVSASSRKPLSRHCLATNAKRLRKEAKRRSNPAALVKLDGVAEFVIGRRLALTWWLAMTGKCGRKPHLKRCSSR